MNEAEDQAPDDSRSEVSEAVTEQVLFKSTAGHRLLEVFSLFINGAVL